MTAFSSVFLLPESYNILISMFQNILPVQSQKDINTLCPMFTKVKICSLQHIPKCLKMTSKNNNMGIKWNVVDSWLLGWGRLATLISIPGCAKHPILSLHALVLCKQWDQTRFFRVYSVHTPRYAHTYFYQSIYAYANSEEKI